MVKFTSKTKVKKVGKQMKNSKLKICSFYVSDWHLTTMLFPFIEEKVKNGNHINTILEKDITTNMQELLNRLQLENQIKEDILKIEWKNKKLIKYIDIKNYLDKILKNKGEIIILVEGSKERIEYQVYMK